MRLESDRLARLVNDLFELSRIQSGALNLHTAPVSVDDLLGDAVAGAAMAARAKQVDLSLAGEGGGPTVCVATPEMIRVLRNLLDNAIRHTDAGGRVTVSSEVEAGSSLVQVSVLDECGGIADDAIDRLFETGYQQDPARSPDQGRGGLGLAIAKGLVRAHSGEIAVRNETGGCRFTVSLPIHTG
jgi:signal transduction histidine kinase